MASTTTLYSRLYTVALFAASLFPLASAQSCTNAPVPSSTPVPAEGYSIQVVANGLTSPRGILFDSAGNLLVVEQLRGISNIRFTDDGDGCLVVESIVDVIDDAGLAIEMNHGLAQSPDGATLYASTSDIAYAFAYDAEARAVAAADRPPQPVVVGMLNGGHSTRTLHYSETEEGGQLVAVRGSDGNLDLEAGTLESGHCHLRAFPLGDDVPAEGYNFTTDGKLLGWGLRNSVGVTEHPETGEIWTVENSIDELMRDGVDIHKDNPGEELNSHGTIADSPGDNHGYPFCATAWVVEDVPNNEALQVGSQFALDVEEQGKDDAYCAEQQAPRLTFQAHTAPLDIKFNGSEEAFVSFHGSWNRDEPVGYRLARIDFADGQPVASSDSTEGAVDVVTNSNVLNCPDACFRPVGIAFDAQGRLFLSSDSTGEIYMVTKKG